MWKFVMRTSTNRNRYGGFMKRFVLPEKGLISPPSAPADSRDLTTVVPTEITLLFCALASFTASAVSPGTRRVLNA